MEPIVSMRVLLNLHDRGDAAPDAEERAFDRLGSIVCPAHQRHVDHLTFSHDGPAHVAEAEICCARMAALVAETIEGNGTIVTFPEPAKGARRRPA